MGPHLQRMAELPIAFLVFLITGFLPVLLFTAQLMNVDGFHASGQCVQLGQANMNPWTGNFGIPPNNMDYKTQYRHGYWTIGTRKFDIIYNFLDFTYAYTGSGTPIDDRVPDYTNYKEDKEYTRRRRRRRNADDDVDIALNYGPQTQNYQRNRSTSSNPYFNRTQEDTSGDRWDQVEFRAALAGSPPDLFDFTPNSPDPCSFKWKVDDGGTPIHPSLNMCPKDDQVEIRTYAVKELIPGQPDSDRVLNGWLYFEVELKDWNLKPRDQLLAVYVQVRDEFFNAIGEFVAEPKQQCNGGPHSEFAQPTPYQVLPCSAVGFREAKVSNALFMARLQALKKKDRTKKYNWTEMLPPDAQMKYGIRFTWRLSEYWCNRHLRFRPEAIIFTKKMAFTNKRYAKPYIIRKAANYWLTHKWYGTADIKREYTTLSCDEPAINYKTGKLVPSRKNSSIFAAPWLLDESLVGRYEDEYMNPNQWDWDDASQHWQLKSCHANTRATYPLVPDPKPGNPDHKKRGPMQEAAADIIPTFAGRCTHHFKKTPSHEALQGCNLVRNVPEFKDLLEQYPNIQKYTTFVQNLTFNQTQLCTVPCYPPTLQNLSEILAYKDHSDESKFSTYTTYHNDERLNRKVEQFYAGRKYHAMLCIYWTMFLMPVGIFIARYLKETFMNVSCIGGHLWFWVHFSSAVLSVMLFLSSLTGISQTQETWGRSTQSYGMAHTILGYMSVGLFMLMVVIGGFRGLHMRMRYAMMTIHSVIGFMIYFLNIIVMILSVYIPASPSMGDDCLSDGTPKDTGKVIIVISIWIAMDSFLHAAMNIMQCLTDRAHGIRRRWWCPIIPIMPADAVEDMVGSYFRKMTMLAYGVAAFIMANTAAGIVIAHTPANDTCLKLTGPRTCKSAWGCSASAEAYVEHIKASAESMNGSYVYVEY